MREELKECHRIVVKVGTSTITYPNGKLNLKRIEELAWVLADLRNRGMEVTLVTSGAIGVGAVRMAMRERPTVMREKQAAAVLAPLAIRTRTAADLPSQSSCPAMRQDGPLWARLWRLAQRAISR